MGRRRLVESQRSFSSRAEPLMIRDPKRKFDASPLHSVQLDMASALWLFLFFFITFFLTMSYFLLLSCIYYLTCTRNDNGNMNGVNLMMVS